MGSKHGPREGEYLLHAGTFNVLVCLFTLSATCLRPVIAWKWSNLLGLFGSLMLIASNWIIPLALMNILHASEKLDLPENFLIFRAFGFSWRGGHEEFTSFVRAVMIFGLTVCIAASACTVAYWKRRLTLMVKSSIRYRNNLQSNQ
jgi:hypothetical protein